MSGAVVELRNRINENKGKSSPLAKMFKHNQKREFPLSARYRGANGKVADTGGESSRVTNNSPTMPVKFEQPVKLTSILSSPGDARKSGNATQDLNKAENMSQLISYKLVSDVKKHQQPPEARRDGDLNIYSIQPAKPAETDTLDALQSVEKCITQLEAKAVQQKNIQKFLEICKSIKPDAQSTIPQDLATSAQKKPEGALQPPLKSFNEVENLLKPGVSDMEAENAETFDRAAKTRSSTSGAERADRGAAKSKPLSRAASDAQEHKVPERAQQKAKPRYIRNVSQVLIAFDFWEGKFGLEFSIKPHNFFLIKN